MTVYDALTRASAQQYGGEAQTDELDDEDLQTLYLEYVNEGMRRIWRTIDPIDVTQLPDIVRVSCPEFALRTSLDEYDPRVFDCLSDYVTWRMLGTGNTAKQARGDWYYSRFVETLSRIPKDSSWDAYYALKGGKTSFVGVWDY